MGHVHRWNGLEGERWERKKCFLCLPSCVHSKREWPLTVSDFICNSPISSPSEISDPYFKALLEGTDLAQYPQLLPDD